ncbi:hypothetical protein I6F35_38145 [Bradyrhizobium sp. BRP22]|uniref:hypothetical protein n=1 Tax=Bradyrhizobium sp. BRP22 TaxID=2793821 RepID=UPI001CD6D391|nr:hypothetical protein [Bradyrhizobium sp. BRP22]MCA1458886.1 hypothetical protein [Bradyrhizobium sp. BRP22]
MAERTTRELGELIILCQLLQISAAKTRGILSRAQIADRPMDRARLEKVLVGLDIAEDNVLSIIRTTKKAAPEAGQRACPDGLVGLTVIPSSRQTRRSGINDTGEVEQQDDHGEDADHHNDDIGSREVPRKPLPIGNRAP